MRDDSLVWRSGRGVTFGATRMFGCCTACGGIAQSSNGVVGWWNGLFTGEALEYPKSGREGTIPLGAEAPTGVAPSSKAFEFGRRAMGKGPQGRVTPSQVRVDVHAEIRESQAGEVHSALLIKCRMNQQLRAFVNQLWTIKQFVTWD